MSRMFSSDFFLSLHCYGAGEIIAKRKVQNNRAGCRRIGPTCGFAASSKVDPGATVGTLQTGYLRVQA
jgi:hypothetical protein